MGRMTILGRLHQIQDAARDCFSRHIASTCELFQALKTHILDAMRKAGQQVGEPVEDKLWELLQNRAHMSRHGYRVNLNRFQGAAAAAQAALPLWLTHLSKRLYICLENDWMTGKAFNERLVLCAGPGEEVTEAGGTTGKRVTMGDSSLKGFVHNAMVVSCMLLGDMTNRRILAKIVQAASRIKQWHTEQNRVALRL